MRSPPPRTLDVLIDHDTPLVVAGVLETLRAQPDLRARATGAEAARTEAVTADVVIADYAGGLRWLAGTALRPAPAPRAAPSPRVLILTAQDREREVRLALERGAHGYLMLDCRADALVAAVRLLARGQRCICHEAAERMIDSMAQSPLTPRELQVLQLLALGRSNKAIGHELGLAVGTVKAHVKAILMKLDVRSRSEAISVCHRRGLVASAAAPVRAAAFVSAGT